MSETGPLGYLVDLVLLVVVIEAIAVIGYWARFRRGIAPADFLPSLLAGALILLALRFAIAGPGWLLPAACLSGAGLAHLIDVVRRWKRR